MKSASIHAALLESKLNLGSWRKRYAINRVSLTLAGITKNSTKPAFARPLHEEVTAFFDKR